MSLSSTLRLSSSLLRRSLAQSRHSRFPYSDSYLRRTEASAVRFFSSRNSQSGKVVGASKRGDDQFTEDSGANNGGLVGFGDDNNGNSRIVPYELHKEATESYLSYALSVLLGRALPDVRDGLKPVHRRILLSAPFSLKFIL